MKEVLISIKPKWCELIANGEKTIEVTKKRPNIDTPFKCYIYCTLDDIGASLYWTKYIARGKVIGEFICDAIYKIDLDSTNFFYKREHDIFYMDYAESQLNLCACIPHCNLKKYLGHKVGYGLHISELNIYDEPKDLSEFRKPCIHPEMPYCPDCKNGYEYISESEAELYRIDGECKAEWWCLNNIKRPPRSWCYVEKTEG